MTDKQSLDQLRKIYLGRLAPSQVSPNARQFFVGVITEADMAKVGLDPANRVAVEREVLDGCVKDALIVRDLVLERGKEDVQPMGMVTPAGLEWAERHAGEGA